ncbi:MAG: MFS transporter, partial [Hyphomicrobiales bacterium]|nr:MFS transporter [Hyphomicrobiales bacterium]
MTTAPDTPDATLQPRASWRESIAVYLQPRVLVVMMLGLSSGLPLALS